MNALLLRGILILYTYGKCLNLSVGEEKMRKTKINGSI